jgi:hypothetical protein
MTGQRQILLGNGGTEALTGTRGGNQAEQS